MPFPAHYPPEQPVEGLQCHAGHGVAVLQAGQAVVEEGGPILQEELLVAHAQQACYHGEQGLDRQHDRKHAAIIVQVMGQACKMEIHG